MAGRRDEILRAALACFHDNGVERTTLDHIRKRSGASTGSIYHFFGGKDDIFGELLLEGFRDLHGAMIEAVEKASSGEGAIRAVVKTYVTWVVEQPQRARFMFRAPHERMTDRHREAFAEHNREFLRAMRDHVVARAEAGEVRRLPMDVFVAVVLGPMKEYASQVVAGIAKTAPPKAIRELGTAAWNAVRRG